METHIAVRLNVVAVALLTARELRRFWALILYRLAPCLGDSEAIHHACEFTGRMFVHHAESNQYLAVLETVAVCADDVVVAVGAALSELVNAD